MSLPVHRASTVVFPTLVGFETRQDRIYDGYSYGLYGTPTTQALELQIAELEGAARALVTPCGQSAVALACLVLAKRRERILMPASMFGPTLCTGRGLLALFGIAVEACDPAVGSDIAALIDQSTRLVWVESPGSITFEVQAQRMQQARSSPQTTATLLLFNALAHGADIAMQSLSKCSGGDSDLLMGSLAVRDEALFRRLKDTARMLGLGVSGVDCFLCARGLNTLHLRLRRPGSAGRAVAEWLARQQQVVRCFTPPGRSIPDTCCGNTTSGERQASSRSSSRRSRAMRSSAPLRRCGSSSWVRAEVVRTACLRSAICAVSARTSDGCRKASSSASPSGSRILRTSSRTSTASSASSRRDAPREGRVSTRVTLAALAMAVAGSVLVSSDASARSIVDRIRQRGFVNCGASQGVPGLSRLDEQGV